MTFRHPSGHEIEESIELAQVSAGAAFAAIGMQSVADDDPPTAEQLDSYRRDGRLWVVTNGGPPVGYVTVRVVGGRGHIEQVTVDPAVQGQGLGRALIDRACQWATDAGFDSVTLSTFRDVAWNAPLYRRLGFEAIPEGELDEALLNERRHEAEQGLEVTLRVFMQRNLV